MGLWMDVGSHRVLVVEDDDELRGLLLDLLASEGFEAAGASNGREALSYLHTHRPPCVILLDLMMPVMSGPEFRAEQVRDEALARIPVVILSASHDVRHQAEALGAAGCFAKPVEFEALFDALRAMC